MTGDETNIFDVDWNNAEEVAALRAELEDEFDPAWKAAHLDELDDQWAAALALFGVTNHPSGPRHDG